MECWAKNDIPARFQYGSHARIPPYLCLPDTGWTISRSRSEGSWTGGNHGYDHMAPEMQAIFIGNGPRFAAGTRLPAFDNTDIAPLLRHLVGLPPAGRSDGRVATFEPVLVPAD